MIQDKPEVLFAATSSGRGVVVMVVVVVVVGERCLEKEREAKCSCIRTNSNNVLVRELADLRWGGVVI